MKAFVPALLILPFATAADTWNILQNQNAVYAGVPDNVHIVNGGKTSTWQECEAKADKAGLPIFTWHDSNQAGYANDCWLRKDGVWNLNAESGHVSGYKGKIPGSQATFDCAMRKFAYTFGKTLLPRQGSFSSLYWALNLNASDCSLPAPSDNVGHRAPTVALPSDAVYVSPAGDDAAVGAFGAPLGSVHAGVEKALTTTSKTVVLREGIHYITSTLELSSRHSGLSIIGYPGEVPTVSGGVELKVQWKAHDTKGGKNIWVADISGQVDDVPGLQLNGARATRARYPNLPGGIEVSCGYGCMIAGNKAKWTAPDFNKYGPVTYYTDSNPQHDRNDTANGWFKHYMIGVNGLCSVYDPPVGYWCSEHPSGGGAFAFRTPSGVTPNAGALPNSPYKDVSEAILNVWRPARWANWMFKVGSYDEKANNFTFGYGGFQGARGENSGGDFFVENVFEELDNPGEFFFDKKTGQLYLYHNGTGAPAADTSVVVPQKLVLVNMSGTQWDPVKNVKLTGTKYTATAYSYMEPHSVPSAGDWALERFAAIYLQGTEGALIDGCTFERLDGNGVMVSGYNRNATVQNSDFAYIGGNAIAAWGFTNETTTDRARPGITLENAPKAGVDGTDGEHPRYTTIVGNSAREVGLYEKQSSFFVQAKTAQSIIHGNVFFNGPRAGINSNDGFGGGDEISRNLVFSTCRESGDHGPFNSWDRQPFLTTVRDGTPSMTPAVRQIHHNFFIDNYSPQENVDNDDGSAYYNTYDNFFVYGGNGMKNDFGGHDNYHHDNIYAYVGQAIGFYDAPMLDGHEDKFYNNKVVMTGNNFGGDTCTGTGATQVHDNSYYTPTGAMTECSKSLADWQSDGHDQGSSVAKTPADADIITWGKAKLLGETTVQVLI